MPFLKICAGTTVPNALVAFSLCDRYGLVLSLCALTGKKKKNYVGRGNSPYIN